MMSDSNTYKHARKLIPSNVKYEIEEVNDYGNDSYKAVLHLDCATSESCNDWVASFSESSLCTWRVRNTFPKGRRGLLFRKDYVCQHSSFNKDHRLRQKTKDTGCTAKLSIKVG